jgi:hypothetical protein
MRALRQAEFVDTTEIAQRFGLGDAHVRRLLRFAYLAPDIVEAIVEGRQPRATSAPSVSERVGEVVAAIRTNNEVAVAFHHAAPRAAFDVLRLLQR